MSIDPPNLIGSDIRAIRKARGLSQRRLAVLAGIRRATLSDIETGKRTGKLETLRAISEAMELRLCDLLDHDRVKNLV